MDNNLSRHGRERQPAHNPQEDLDLWAQWIKGDSQAGDRLLAAYYPDILTFHYIRVKDREQAQDLTQDTLQRAYLQKAKYDPSRGTIRTWLFVIAYNINVDFWRGLKRLARHLGKPVSMDVGEFGWLSRASEALHDQSLEDEIRRLPEFYRSMCGLLMAGLTSPECAVTLGLPLRTFEKYKDFLLRYLHQVLTLERAAPRPPMLAPPRKFLLLEKE